jgi:predicted NAD/FAD-dependent oxidoreductase
VVLGTPPDPAHLDATVRAQLARLYRTSTTRWELLAAHHVPAAVPAMPAPHDLRRPVRLLAGLYVCGDHRDTSTVQGALHSARRAAHAVLTDLDVRPALSEESLETAA